MTDQEPEFGFLVTWNQSKKEQFFGIFTFSGFEPTIHEKYDLRGKLEVLNKAFSVFRAILEFEKFNFWFGNLFRGFEPDV